MGPHEGGFWPPSAKKVRTFFWHLFIFSFVPSGIFNIIIRLSSILRPEGSGRERMDYNSSYNLIAFGRKTEESPFFLGSRKYFEVWYAELFVMACGQGRFYGRAKGG